MNNNRLAVIETAAKKLTPQVEPAHESPSLEEDMRDYYIHVFGDPNHITPEVAEC